jgi:asparagine synthase (glutamine-hydrolysing)
MCGIAGIVNLAEGLGPCEASQLTDMVATIGYRGPDEFGTYRDHHAGLAHARLSIIDLATGQQPLANETDSIWIVFNGEIFNYIELAKELAALGHTFRTRSDTEVIVHAYEQWGEDAFRRFNGQWALALWDARRKSLVLARDPFGVRPLYICVHERRLYFASEVKAIFAAEPGIPRRFDPVGLDQLFTFWTPVAPATVFAGVEELPPGCVRTYCGHTVRETRAYDPQYPVADDGLFRGTLEDATEEVRAALEDATRLRMVRSDVPVGSYLSGGLDSSLVAALGLRAKGAQFSTFSLRFKDAEYDETPYQRLMSEHLGSDHHEVLVGREDIARVFPSVIAHTERPILRTAPAPLYLLSKLVHDSGIKVVLTGEGADELFAGYDLFREAKVRRFWAREPQSIRRPKLLQRLYPYLARSPVAQDAMMRRFFGQRLEDSDTPGFGHALRWSGTSALKRLFSADLRSAAAPLTASDDLLASLPDRFAGWTSLAKDQYLEIRTLLSGYLLSSQGDRMLMAHSVEGRFPFLDRRVAALAESLPAEYKLRVLDEKHVLKRAAAGLIPQRLIERPKQPYRAPDALSFCNAAAAEWIADVADERSLREAGVFDPAAASKLIQKCVAHDGGSQFSNADNMGLVGLFSTQLLYAQLLRHAPRPDRTIALTTRVDRVHAGSELPA